MTEGEKKPSFKVVDRRRFTDEGDERQGPDVPRADPVRVDAVRAEPGRAEPGRADAAPKASSTSAEGAPVAAAKPEGNKPKPPTPASGLTFSVFVQSLAQQALMQMGLMPWPHGQRELALEQARDTIDILELLKAKTDGNLDAEEKQLMDSVVYELKLSFVEVQQAIARSRAGGGKPPGMPGMPR